MAIAIREETIFCAIESAYNVEATIAGTDAIQVENLQWNPTEALRLIEREIIDGSLNAKQALYGGSLFGFTFDVEIKGSGVAGTAPRLGRLLRAAAMSETIVALTSVTYEPTSVLANHESLTVHLREGPNLRRVTGCRGNVVSKAPGGVRGMLACTLIGHIASEAVAAAPTPAFESTLPPPFLNAAVDSGGFAATIESLEVDLQNTVAFSTDPNSPDGYGQVRITTRKTGGSFNPEAQSIATKDFIGELRAGTRQAITTGVVGATAGNRWAISLPAASWRDAGPGDRESLRVYDMAIGAAETATLADDEFSIQFT